MVSLSLDRTRGRQGYFSAEFHVSTYTRAYILFEMLQRIQIGEQRYCSDSVLHPSTSALESFFQIPQIAKFHWERSSETSDKTLSLEELGQPIFTVPWVSAMIVQMFCHAEILGSSRGRFRNLYYLDTSHWKADGKYTKP